MLFYNKKIFKRCFTYRGRWWYRNIGQIPNYFYQLRFLTKHGYDIAAQWDTFSWFISTMREILTYYKEHHCGVPIIVENFPVGINLSDEEKKIIDDNAKQWDNIVNQMIELLDLMDECNPIYDQPEYQEDIWKADREMNKAKEEFFQLFSKYFYYLWD